MAVEKEKSNNKKRVFRFKTFFWSLFSFLLIALILAVFLFTQNMLSGLPSLE